MRVSSDELKAFDLAEIAGWFKQSSDRIYAKTAPVAEFEVPLTLTPGMHKIDVPPELAMVDELIVPTSYKAMSSDEPAFALFVLYLQAGLVEVLPQTAHGLAVRSGEAMDFTRGARSRIAPNLWECFGVGTFLLHKMAAAWQSGSRRIDSRSTLLSGPPWFQ